MIESEPKFCTECGAALSARALHCSSCLHVTPAASALANTLYQGSVKLERFIGKGGMGRVYLGSRGGQAVALKLLHEEFLDEHQAVARFKREARLMESIEHPNVMPILGHTASDEGLSILMPYLRDGALSDYLSRVHDPDTKELDPESRQTHERAQRIMEQMLSGLVELHRRGIVHRDIKPDNIMMRGEDIILGDLGVARLTSAETTLTAKHQVIGTLRYMAPELHIKPDRESSSKRSDVYACGLVYFELLAGCAPLAVGNETPFSIMRAHVSDPPQMDRLPRNTSKGIRQVIERALAKDPEHRFADADEMLGALIGLDLFESQSFWATNVRPNLFGILALIFVVCAALGLYLVQSTPCEPGHYGASCEQRCDCAASVECDDGRDGTGACVCAPGYYGARCDASCPVVDRQVCAGHGGCLDGSVGTGQCVCDEGYGGTDCASQILETAAGMVHVPGAEFVSGVDEPEGDELPRVDRYKAGFSLDQHEVTVRRYRRCVEAGVCSEPKPGSEEMGAEHDLHPITGVTFEQANTFCSWGGGWLPDEVEWELAARGADARMFPWGDEPPACQHAVASLGEGCTTAAPQRVGQHKRYASPYHIQDMAGNVWEWVNQAHASAIVEVAPVRGGGWRSGPEELRTTSRQLREASRGYDDVGFRCAAAAPTPRR